MVRIKVWISWATNKLKLDYQPNLKNQSHHCYEPGWRSEARLDQMWKIHILHFLGIHEQSSISCIDLFIHSIPQGNVGSSRSDRTSPHLFNPWHGSYSLQIMFALLKQGRSVCLIFLCFLQCYELSLGNKGHLENTLYN